MRGVLAKNVVLNLTHYHCHPPYLSKLHCLPMLNFLEKTTSLIPHYSPTLPSPQPAPSPSLPFEKDLILITICQDFVRTSDNGLGVTVNKYSPEKVLPPNYSLGCNYSPSTYLLVNKFSVLGISTPLDIDWIVVYSHLTTPGNNIFLGNMYSLVKPLCWNKQKQPLKGVLLNSVPNK